MSTEDRRTSGWPWMQMSWWSRKSTSHMHWCLVSYKRFKQVWDMRVSVLHRWFLTMLRITLPYWFSLLYRQVAVNIPPPETQASVCLLFCTLYLSICIGWFGECMLPSSYVYPLSFMLYLRNWSMFMFSQVKLPVVSLYLFVVLRTPH